MTNYEWIKSMSIDEMSFILDKLNSVCDQSFFYCLRDNRTCNECVKEWLMKEHKDDGETKGLSEGADS